MATKQYDLPRFRKALSEHSPGGLSVGTHWRYRNGFLPPPLGSLLIENPALAQALAEDAAALAAARAAQAGAARPTADCDEIARKGVAG